MNAEEGEEADGAESREIKRGAILYVAFDPKQNKLLVTTSDDGTARLWDAETGKITHTLKAHENSIPYAEFSPDGKHVVTTSADGTARIWNVETGEREALLAGHAGGVLHAAFSPDGKRVVTSSSDRTARLWNARTGKFLREIKGHKDDVVWAAFSPYDDTTEREVVTASNYGTVLTASRDGIARLWDVGSAALLREFKGHTAALSHAEFYNRKDGRNASSQGVRILTASYDGTVRLWQLPAVYFKEPAELVKHACEMAKKSGVTTFTDDEMSEPSFLIRFPKSRYYNDPCERPTLIKWQYYKHLLSRVIGEPVK